MFTGNWFAAPTTCLARRRSVAARPAVTSTSPWASSRAPNVTYRRNRDRETGNGLPRDHTAPGELAGDDATPRIRQLRRQRHLARSGIGPWSNARHAAAL